MQNNFNGSSFYCRNKPVCFGWGMTGKMTGLGIMLIGIICLLMALWIYNCPFAEKKKRK